MDETLVTFTPRGTTAASFIANGQEQASVTSAAYRATVIGGRLITDDGYYIADSDGNNIIIGGVIQDGPNQTSTMWSVSDEIL